MSWKEISENLFILNVSTSDGQAYSFSLKKGARGIFGRGEAWRLTQHAPYELLLVCFTTKDDGNKIYKEDYQSKVWTFEDLVDEATEICKKIID